MKQTTSLVQHGLHVGVVVCSEREVISIKHIRNTEICDKHGAGHVASSGNARYLNTVLNMPLFGGSHRAELLSKRMRPIAAALVGRYSYVTPELSFGWHNPTSNQTA
eukprot:1137901-Pelagomonas_calceolata.AAC.1